MSNFSERIATPLRWVGALLAAALLAGCERPPVETIQNGYRGTGMEHVFNQRVVNQDLAKNTAPASLPAASAPERVPPRSSGEGLRCCFVGVFFCWRFFFFQRWLNERVRRGKRER